MAWANNQRNMRCWTNKGMSKRTHGILIISNRTDKKGDEERKWPTRGKISISTWWRYKVKNVTQSELCLNHRWFQAKGSTHFLHAHFSTKENWLSTIPLNSEHTKLSSADMKNFMYAQTSCWTYQKYLWNTTIPYATTSHHCHRSPGLTSIT